MQISRRPMYLEAGPHNAAQPRDQDRNVRCQHPCVRYQSDVCGQRRPLVSHRGDQGGTADFLFAVEHQPEVERQPRRGREPGFNGREVGHELAFVVACASRVEIIADSHRTERVGGPGTPRSTRLNVVVTIHQHRGASRSPFPGSGDHRGCLATPDFDISKADARERAGQPGCASDHVPRAPGISADRRVTKQSDEALQGRIPARPGVAEGLGGRIHRQPPSGLVSRRSVHISWPAPVRRRDPASRSSGARGRRQWPTWHRRRPPDALAASDG